MYPILGYNFGPLFGTRDFLFGGMSLFERSGFGFRFGFRFGTHFGPKSLRKQGRRDKRKRRKLQRRKCGLDIAGAIREALEVVWRNNKIVKQKGKSQFRSGVAHANVFSPKEGRHISQPGHNQVTTRSHPGHIQVTSRSYK